MLEEDPDIKGIEDVISKNKLNLVNDEMVSKSLQFAYKLTYQSRNAGDDVIGIGGAINATQNFLICISCSLYLKF